MADETGRAAVAPGDPRDEKPGRAIPDWLRAVAAVLALLVVCALIVAKAFGLADFPREGWVLIVMVLVFFLNMTIKDVLKFFGRS